MTVLRRFWCPWALLGAAAGIFMGGGAHHVDVARELWDWNEGHGSSLWDACRRVLPVGGVYAPYAIRYRAGTEHKLHFDGKHTRLVVLARAADSGGELCYEGTRVVLAPGDAAVFRAERLHEVTRVGAGERWVLTMGVEA